MPEIAFDVDQLARRLDRAWETRQTVAPLSESEGLASTAVAYQIQTRWNELRLARGDRVIGHKIGLTSRAMQEQMGVDQPDYGRLWESRFFPATEGIATIPGDLFLQPRIEGELAFLIGKPLDGPAITTADVLAATEAVAVSVEVIDSRFTDWKIRLADTIADNSSYGGFALGRWDRTLAQTDLRTLGMMVSHNGKVVGEAIGAAALGHPAAAVAWLASTLHGLGTGIQPGDIVLSGSLVRALPMAAGDEAVIDVYGQPPLTVVFQ